MCVVTWISKIDGFCALTSNRDISISRPHSYPPNKINFLNKPILYPEDPLGKGSWIATSSKAIVCLLNETSSNINQKYNYSRGKLVLELSTKSLDLYNKRLLSNYDSFQLVKANFSSKQLSHLKWNGSKLVLKQLKWNGSYLWSSNTIYLKNHKLKKEQRFKDFIEKNPYNSNLIFDFHDKERLIIENGIRNLAEELVITTSITQVKVKKSLVSMTYKDLLNNSLHCRNI